MTDNNNEECPKCKNANFILIKMPNYIAVICDNCAYNMGDLE
jgi:predicted nucleic-acid-binding Zn-ribbon protein